MAKLNLGDKKKQWIKSFKEEKFQDQLLAYRNEIETEINTFISNIKENRSEIMMFESLESRVKSVDSFTEKLSRNEYLNEWDISEDINENQTNILLKLPDVIGYRMSCYFMEDEKEIYEGLLEYQFEHIILDNDTNLKQSNGHPIYKLDGTYEKDDVKCNFEIQIKSLVHNIWGEVEHKTIYKRRGYDFNITNRKAITEGTYNILQASDTQLNSLFDMNYDTDKMIKGLFHEQTKEIIEKKFLTDILGRAYNNFYEIFYMNYRYDIRVFVAKKILNVNMKKIKYKGERDDLEAIKFRDEMYLVFKKYDIEMICFISELLIKYDGKLDFYKLVLDILLPEKNDVEYGDEEDFSINEDEEDFPINEDEQEYLNDIYIAIEKMKELDLKEVKKHA